MSTGPSQLSRSELEWEDRSEDTGDVGSVCISLSALDCFHLEFKVETVQEKESVKAEISWKYDVPLVHQDYHLKTRFEMSCDDGHTLHMVGVLN